ncbi:hypothetical protein BH09VER1_BH09VER1_53270 [soil metagenome]
MPASKIVPVGRGGLGKVLRYLTDPGAESHREYRLTPLRYLASRSQEDFLRLAHEGLRAHEERRLSGRDPDNVAYWYIVRFPDGAGLTEVERRFCWRRIIEEADVGGDVSAVSNEHINRIFGSEDFNLVKPAFDLIGLPTREKGAHPLYSLRRQMDEAAKLMNIHRRRSATSAVLSEMPLIRSARMQKKGVDLVASLAGLPKLPMKVDDLLPALWSFGWEARLTGPRKKHVEVTDVKAGWRKELAVDHFLEMLILARVRRFAARAQYPGKTKKVVADILIEKFPALEP